MGLQLIFAVETNKTCKSDWIYIKDTISKFYTIDQAHIKLSTVYMDGKSNYTKKQKEVKSLVSQYLNVSKNNKSQVIYCFDCDEYDNKQEDMQFLEKARCFCKDNEYEFVWFCKDIERVYLGKKVNDSKKREESARFKSRCMIDNIKEQDLSVLEYRHNTSNILVVLDKFIERK